MNTRKTSIDCYHQIKNEGLLSNKRQFIYEHLFENTPCTSLEAMQGVINKANVFPTAFRARFTELRQLGVIYEKRIKKCSISGRNAIEWDLTNNLPLDKKITHKSKKQKIDLALNGLRDLYINRSILTDDNWKGVAALIIDI